MSMNISSVQTFWHFSIETMFKELKNGVLLIKRFWSNTGFFFLALQTLHFVNIILLNQIHVGDCLALSCCCLRCYGGCCCCCCCCWGSPSLYIRDLIRRIDRGNPDERLCDRFKMEASCTQTSICRHVWNRPCCEERLPRFSSNQFSITSS